MRTRWMALGLAWTLACTGGSGASDGSRASVDAATRPVPADAAQSPDAAVGLGMVDRAGHPLTTVLLVPGPLQDEYNAESSFDSLPRVMQEALEARLEALDRIALGDAGPDPVDWPVPDGGTHPLLPMFATDTLLLDSALSCTRPDGGFASTYLDIEQEIYGFGGPHTSCAGRVPGDDVIDRTLGLLVTADRDGAPPVRQGAFGPTKPASPRFPYLADPN